MNGEFQDKILLKELPPEEIENAINFSLLMGLNTISAEFPITSLERGIRPSSHQAEELFRTPPGQENKDFVAHSAPSDFVSEHAQHGLEGLFTRGRVLVDSDGDFLPDRIDLKLVLPKNPSQSMVEAACNIAFRLGMETTGFAGSLVADGDYRGNVLKLQQGEVLSLKNDPFTQNLLGREGSVHMVLTGDGDELLEFVSALCNYFPLASDGMTLTQRMMELSRSLERKDFDGQLAFLKDMEAETYLSYTSQDFMSLQMEYPKLLLYFHKDPQKKKSKCFQIPWEVDVLNEELEKIYKQIQPGNQVFIQIAVSEDKAVRSKLKEEIESHLDALGAKPEVSVLCSYKQGYSWIEEDILPVAIEKSREIPKNQLLVQIFFKEFLPEGVTDWDEESGAIPTYGANSDKLGQWLDLPIRFLQELYPIADEIQAQMGIPKQSIQFHKLPREHPDYEKSTYVVRLLNKEEVLLKETYQVATGERQYLDEFPQMGLVHPPTGYLRGHIQKTGANSDENGAVAQEIASIQKFYQRINTDLEEVWELYQKVVLPEVKEYLLNQSKLLEEKPESSNPKALYFEKLELNITLSETDERLSSREDMISSLDALHEDVYFTGIEYLKAVGLQHGLNLEAPGLILPRIKVGKGAPKFSFVLEDHYGKEPFFVQHGEKYPLIAQQKAHAHIEEVLWEEGLVLGIRVKGVERQLLQNYGELMQAGHIAFGSKLGDYKGIQLRLGDEQFYVALPPTQKQPKTMTIDQVDIMENQVIGYDEYLQIINALKKVPGICVNEVGHSFQGRKIYAIEFVPSSKGYVSNTKRVSLLPSLVINARHHANEVSSTNGTFILLRELLQNKQYKDLADRMNLAILPMENVDGAAIHYELQLDNPNWSLHAARFNALGREFIRDYFQQDTIHTEALAGTWIWEKLLPDVYVDDHGVPSHEWAQPFSGYTAPAYKGFWLPRSLIYGYYWTINNPQYAANVQLNKKLEDVIADAIGKDEEISRWNRDWMWQFENYAHRWMPKQYPADYYKEMINYWIFSDYDSNHKYFSIRFPWITSIAYTSEVADETAQGEYLYLCARTHALHDLATIQWMLEGESVFEKFYHVEEQRASLKRLRPLCFK